MPGPAPRPATSPDDGPRDGTADAWLTEAIEDVRAELVHLARQVHHVYHADQIFVSTWRDCTFTVCHTFRDCTGRLAALAAPSRAHQPTAKEHDHDRC